MRRKRVRVAFAALAALVLAAAMAIVAGRLATGARQAVPGNEGMAQEGPASAAEAEFMQRAYPDDTIAVSDMDAARAAFTAATKRPFAKNTKPGNWIPVGPSEALYPATEFRNSFLYVPNEYLACGRTTWIALRQNCSPGGCRMWITPAGGGVWRTNDALAASPRWTYRS